MKEREAGRVHFLGVLIEKLNICTGRATFDLPCRVVSIRVVTTTFYARPFCLTHSLTTMMMMMMKLNNDNNDNQVQRSLTNCSVEMLQHTQSHSHVEFPLLPRPAASGSGTQKSVRQTGSTPLEHR